MHCNNTILASLGQNERGAFLAECEHVWLEPNLRLVSTEEPPGYAYFPEAGIISVIVRPEEYRQCHIGIYGAEGCGSFASILGAPTSPYDEIVQIGGSAHRISVARLLSWMQNLPDFRKVLLRFCHAFMLQICETARCNTNGFIERRLARWLLMLYDRVSASRIEMTHGRLAEVIGVRRAGVTEAIHILEERRLIRAERGMINILAPKELASFAGDYYGQPEQECRRLI
jgi:CRP-like cAMP-binding protein